MRWRRKSAKSWACRWGRRISQRFSDGETYVQILENVRGADVFMVQPTCDPVDLHLMQLLLSD